MKRLTGTHVKSTTLCEVVDQDIQALEHTSLVLLASVALNSPHFQMLGS